MIVVKFIQGMYGVDRWFSTQEEEDQYKAQKLWYSDIDNTFKSTTPATDRLLSICGSANIPPEQEFPPAGLVETYCEGVDKMGLYNDGMGGQYNELIEENSTDCGYRPPVELISVSCQGTTKYGTYSNGVDPSYTEVIEENSPDCGYTPPAPPPPPPSNATRTFCRNFEKITYRISDNATIESIDNSPDCGYIAPLTFYPTYKIHGTAASRTSITCNGNPAGYYKVQEIDPIPDGNGVPYDGALKYRPERNFGNDRNAAREVGPAGYSNYPITNRNRVFMDYPNVRSLKTGDEYQAGILGINFISYDESNSYVCRAGSSRILLGEYAGELNWVDPSFHHWYAIDVGAFAFQLNNDLAAETDDNWVNIITDFVSTITNINFN